MSEIPIHAICLVIHTTICIKVNLDCRVASAVEDLASVNFGNWHFGFFLQAYISTLLC